VLVILLLTSTVLMDSITSFDWTDGSARARLSISPPPDGLHEERTMSPTAVPTRITIDFRDAVLPSRTWILGVDEAPSRVDLIAFDRPPAITRPTPRLGAMSPSRQGPARPTAAVAECACPEFCERDHANE
jgi:hypothetical protein